MCTGKIYWDLLTARAKAQDTSTAIVRFEQMHPIDDDGLSEALEPFAGAELVWVQEEPRNQGAWPFLGLELPERLGGRSLRCVSRVAAASPATGSSKKHQAEQAALIEQAFAR